LDRISEADDDDLCVETELMVRVVRLAETASESLRGIGKFDLEACEREVSHG
jgi:hypothetical protein